MLTTVPKSTTLPESQLATLAEHGEEGTAEVGDVLYRVGDRRYPLIAIVEGEVAIVDAAGNEIVRHGAARFLGELNLLSGQTVFVTAVVTQPLHYIAVAPQALRALLYEDGALSDLLLSTFVSHREALQRVQGLARARAARGGRPARRRRRAGWPRRRGLPRLRGSRDACSGEHRARRQAGSSRRIENYLGFPAGISGAELTGRAVVQARKFGARPATPYRAARSSPATDGTSCDWKPSRR